MTDSPARSWTAWHLHLATSATGAHDRVLREVVGPVIRARPGRPWFFLRYWQHGPHIRFRMRDLTPQQVSDISDRLAAHHAEAAEPRADERRLDAQDHARQSERLAAAGELGAALPATDVATLLPPGVHPAFYEPEFDRYGGRDLMGLSEDLFTLSSRLVLAFLAQPRDTGARAVLALHATAAALHTLPDVPARVAFCEAGLMSWRDWLRRLGHSTEQVDATVEALRDPGRLPPTLSTAVSRHLEQPVTEGPLTSWYAAHLEATGVWAQTAAGPGRILLSHTHMLHNRLGLGVLDELATYGHLLAQLTATRARTVTP
ncbi:thiopeptide-type bacteriocin biosynthesis protein [Streptomyces sp. NPDC126510]|uniref:thiopeptide-type bacteriocin biosynthesis protein n=1 Tax=Streptomyces sp. NPDC126510 TaxID=3155317 RepID=UPI0033307AFA